MSTEEFTKIMHGCAEYEKAAVETLREHCPYFKYEQSRGDRREKSIANDISPLMKSMLDKSERIFALDSMTIHNWKRKIHNC